MISFLLCNTSCLTSAFIFLIIRCNGSSTRLFLNGRRDLYEFSAFRHFLHLRRASSCCSSTPRIPGNAQRSLSFHSTLTHSTGNGMPQEFSAFRNLFNSSISLPVKLLLNLYICTCFFYLFIFTLSSLVYFRILTGIAHVFPMFILFFTHIFSYQ